MESVAYLGTKMKEEKVGMRYVKDGEEGWRVLMIVQIVVAWVEGDRWNTEEGHWNLHF